MREEILLRLVEKLYWSAADVDQWQSFLEALADALRCSTTQLIVHDFSDHSGAIAASARFDPDLQRLYDQYYGGINVFFATPSALTAAGGVYTGSMLCANRALERSEYYCDFFRKVPAYHALGATIRGGPHDIAFISCLRDKNAGSFGKEVDWLRLLLPHLQRALEIHRGLLGAEGLAYASLDALEQLDRAVLLLDAAGSVVNANRAAADILARRDGLTLDHQELHAATPHETSLLRRAITDAGRTSAGAGFGSGGTIMLARPSGRRPLAVVVAPVAASRVFLKSRSVTAMVFISDPESPSLPTEDALQTLLGLTPAEARLTHLLAQGLRLTQAAERLDVRTETLRTRLKDIFAKTNTHRQSELVQRVIELGSRL
jgi:DNA-binding CsgD family transcriptional regulator